MTNKRFAATYGTTPQALFGKNLSDLGKHEEEADFMAAEDKEVLESQQPLVAEFLLRQKFSGDALQARDRKLRVTKIPYKDEAGGDCLLAIGEDLTQTMEFNKDLRSRAEAAELRLARLQKQHELVSTRPREITFGCSCLSSKYACRCANTPRCCNLLATADAA